MTDRAGQQVGNYRLLRLLGEGGFAEVYLGAHSYLGTQAAIKLLHTHISQSDFDLFLQEARTLAALVHPNIVRVLDFGIDDQTPFLVMAYAPGGSLRTRHPKGTRLPLPTVIEYIKQAASALQFAHERKLVHRDIKPENMLIGANKELLLSDFGIALIAQSSHYQSTRDMAGTISYMAPEQINAHLRPASDQYSLGVVAYEWLSGTRPFQGSFTEVAIKHSLTPPPSLLEQVPTLPEAVERVIFTALTKNPEERFSSVLAFAQALELASQEEQSSEFSTQKESQARQIASRAPEDIDNSTNKQASIKPSPIQGSDKRGIKRRRVLIGAAGLAAAGMTGAGIIWFTRPQHPAPQPSSFFYTKKENVAVLAIAWSPNGQQIASGSADHTVQVWNAHDGSPAFTYRGHSGPVNAIAWSPDGRHIASGSADHTVQVWDALNGNPLYTYRGHSGIVNAVAWSMDNAHLASASDDNTVQIWDALHGSRTFTYRGHKAGVNTVSWSPDSRLLASGSDDKTVQIWNSSNDSAGYIYEGHRDVLTAVVWSPDGKSVASASYDKTVQVWNASNGSRSVLYTGHTDVVSSIAWLPAGQRIISGSYDTTVQVWNALNARIIATYKDHSDRVNMVALSPGGKYIASCSADTTVHIRQL
ncbi:hypothetical protein EPA93_10855 [Ktedonosporobacter rubrisoli]|uniref:Protein kinase domain-containing protein n=1 Tax=Ktedonosporobacter rubrisoli TaxID=2509675 RepID=A0A4V0YYJ9_KTERU|nr:serine/threonine-protein kinase [Ktedonosporobacter rubrisoli]QBD76481.1 hypothetical protein EPA93_10855 [Ktedonosporobacter rubrisoli]